MNNYWIIWPIGIVLWLALGWAEFGVLEGKALSKEHGPNQISLSMFIYKISTKFPLAMATGCAAVGYFFGVLFTHFYWHWCPLGSISAG